MTKQPSTKLNVNSNFLTSKTQSLKNEVTQTNSTCIPKFMFGSNSDVKNCIHFLDEFTVIYPCGHNVVIYRTDDHSQRFLPGLEGSEGITALAL